MKFNFKDVYNTTADFVAEAINQTIDLAINTSMNIYNFVKRIDSTTGREKNWNDIKKKVSDFAKIILNEAKKILKDITDNWEAAIILTLASVGLTHIIGSLPETVNLPAFIETPMVAPVISVLIILFLVFLIERKMKVERKMKGANNEISGARTS